MGHGRDRRSAKRIGHVCEVECASARSGRVVTRISDLSSTGAFVESSTCFAPGTILKLQFKVNGAAVETTGEVRYTMPETGMGVRFVDLAPEHVAVLQSVLEDEPAAGAHAGEWPHNSDTHLKQLFLGSFTVISLFDVIQMIENSRLTGALTVALSSAKGEVHFNDGEIVGARTDCESGAEALAKFLNAAEGTFEFRKSAVQFERTINAASNIGLLLDLLGAKDEEAALR